MPRKKSTYMCPECGELREPERVRRSGSKCFEGHQMIPLTDEEAEAAYHMTAAERIEWAKNGYEIEQNEEGKWRGIIRKIIGGKG